MTTAPKSKRANYFSDVTGEEDFQQSFLSLLMKVKRQAFSRYMNPENTQRFKHGGQWLHPGAPQALVGGMKTHSSETAISFESIAKHDLAIIDQVLGKLTEDMGRQLEQTMYSTISAATESTGNTIDAQKAGSPREAFAQMLEMVEFSVDKFGQVHLPEIHTGPGGTETLAKSISEAPPEFHQRVEGIKARKIAEALEREIQRKSRFACYGEA